MSTGRKVAIRTQTQAVQAVAAHLSQYLSSMSMEELLDQLGEPEANDAEEGRVSLAVERMTKRLDRMAGSYGMEGL